MNAEEVRQYCLRKRGAVEEWPFGPQAHVIKAGGKMFALIGDREGGSVSLKCDPFIADMLRGQYEAVTPGYHMNKRHWNTILLDGSVPAEEIAAMIDQSYDLVVRGLTRAARERL